MKNLDSRFSLSESRENQLVKRSLHDALLVHATRIPRLTETRLRYYGSLLRNQVLIAE